MTDNDNKMRAPLLGLICPPALPAGLRLALVALGARRRARRRSSPPAAQAELVIDVRRGNFQPMPIAVADFAGEGDLGQRVAGHHRQQPAALGLLRADRQGAASRRSSPPSTRRRASRPGARSGAQGLVTGPRLARRRRAASRPSSGSGTSIAGQQIAGQQYFTDPNNWRRVGHIISDAVYTKITGVGGFFDTRVVFVDESGPKENRRKRLAIMDQDGANVRFLTQGDQLVVTPRYSPATQDIAYMSQAIGPAAARAGHQPRDRLAPGGRQLPRHDLEPALLAGRAADRHEPAAGRQRQHLRDGPRLAHDDAHHLDERDRHLAVLLAGRQRRSSSRATAAASSRSTSWAPDGSNPRRISFGDGSYSQPAWSPRGDYIAFTKRGRGGFAIGIMRPDGSGERILTEGFHNESPSWAPNGQYIMFFRDPGRPGRRQALHGRHHRPRRAAGADPVLRVRPDLVAAPLRGALTLAISPRSGEPADPHATRLRAEWGHGAKRHILTRGNPTPVFAPSALP